MEKEDNTGLFVKIKTAIINKDVNLYHKLIPEYEPFLFEKDIDFDLIEFSQLLFKKEIFLDLIEKAKVKNKNIPEKVKKNLWINCINKKNEQEAEFLYNNPTRNLRANFFEVNNMLPSLFFYAFIKSPNIFRILAQEGEIPIEHFIENKKSLKKFGTEEDINYFFNQLHILKSSQHLSENLPYKAVQEKKPKI